MKDHTTLSCLLNEREKAIVQRLATGLSDQQIADELFLSSNTIRWYNRQIYSKLGVNSRTQAIARVKDLGLLGDEPLLSRPIFLVPGRHPFFLGREDVLAYLQRQFQERYTAMTFQAQAICGLGGMGKTQVAIEYAHRHAQDYQAIFWSQAESHDTLVASFLEIASLLHLPERDEQDQRVVVAVVKAWLRQNAGWLLILDNADDLTLLAPFLPSPLSGHLLLTTRAQALGGLANRIELEVLTLDSSALLLLRRAGILSLDAAQDQADPTSWQTARQIAQNLGCLPLALDQAGAYLEETRCSLQQYLELSQNHRAYLLHRRGGLALDHPDSIATTWSLSFELIERLCAPAADLLRLCAVLHPDAIPEALFLQAATHLGPLLATLGSDPLAFNQALALIQKYSLLQRNGSAQTLSMHRLVQDVLVDTMTGGQREQWLSRAIAALNVVFPAMMHQDGESWHQCNLLLPHVLTVAEHTNPQTLNLELASVLTRASRYLVRRAQYEQAEPLLQRALSMCEALLGGEHPQVALPLNVLANLYYEQGNYEQAELLLQRALHLWEKEAAQVPPPEMVGILNSLAIISRKRGNYEQAETLFQRTLRLSEQMFGQDHRAIASYLSNLARLYYDQRHYEQAEPLVQHALHLWERVDLQHPEIAHPLTNLADIYLEQGRYAEAEPLYQRALQVSEQALGDSHPRVAFTLNGLACLYVEQGRYAEAEQIFQRALTIRSQRLGTQHDDTAASLQDFAHLYEVRNQPEQALDLYQQAQTILEQCLGSMHRRVVANRANCARLLRLCGRPEEATTLETPSCQ